MEVHLTQTKQTKGTVVFATDEPDAPITSVYIRKGKKIEGANVADVPGIVIRVSIEP